MPAASAVTTRKARKAQTRAALKAAAWRCLETSAAGEISIAAIARECGVATGTVYVHFAGKEALLTELLDDFNVVLANRLEPIWDTTALDIPAAVRSSAEVFLDYWARHRGFVEAYAQTLSMGVDRLQLRDGINPPVAELLERRLTAAFEAFGAADPDIALRIHLVAHGVLALWLRIGLQYVLGEGLDRETVLESLTAMTVGMLMGFLRPPKMTAGHP